MKAIDKATIQDYKEASTDKKKEAIITRIMKAYNLTKDEVKSQLEAKPVVKAPEVKILSIDQETHRQFFAKSTQLMIDALKSIPQDKIDAIAKHNKDSKELFESNRRSDYDVMYCFVFEVSTKTFKPFVGSWNDNSKTLRKQYNTRLTASANNNLTSKETIELYRRLNESSPYGTSLKPRVIEHKE